MCAMLHGYKLAHEVQQAKYLLWKHIVRRIIIWWPVGVIQKAEDDVTALKSMNWFPLWIYPPSKTQRWHVHELFGKVRFNWFLRTSAHLYSWANMQTNHAESVAQAQGQKVQAYGSLSDDKPSGDILPAYLLDQFDPSHDSWAAFECLGM